MEQRELPSNSLTNAKTKPEKREKLKPVISEGASIKKKSFGERFVDKFISKDVDDIPRYLTDEVLIPLAKKTFLDTMSILLNGRGSRSSSGGEIIDYSKKYRTGSVYFVGSSDSYNRSGTRRRTFNDLYFKSCAKGDLVWDSIKDHFAVYNNITISEILELSGLEKLIEFTDNGYGWFSMKGMEKIYDNKGGMTLKLPPARCLDD